MHATEAKACRPFSFSSSRVELCVHTFSWAFSVVRAVSWCTPSPVAVTSAGRSHTFTVQSWLPDTMKDAFILNRNTHSNNSLTPLFCGRVCVDECDKKPAWLQEHYLEQVMEPTALEWPEPRATQHTWPLPLSICHTHTDLSWRHVTILLLSLVFVG